MQIAREPDATETDRVFCQVERHLDKLTTTIPMVDIEDLPVAYQRQVTGVPMTWIRLFQHVPQVVLSYTEVHGEAHVDAP